MISHMVIEEEKSKAQPLLIVDTNSGLQNKLLDLLAQSLESKLKIYALTKKNVSKAVSIISPLSVQLLDKLSDDLRYAVIFLDEESQKKKTLEIIDRLVARGTLIVVLIPYRVSNFFIDVIINLKDRRDISVGLVGDLFGESHLSSPVSKVIENAVNSHEVIISGNELLPVFPVSETDLVNSVQHILFSKKREFLYSLFYKHPQTLLSLVHLLKRIEPELSISFKDVDSQNLNQKTQEQLDKYLSNRLGLSPKRFENFIGFEKSVEMMDLKIPQRKKDNRYILGGKGDVGKVKETAGKFFKLLVYGFSLYLLVSFAVFFLSLLFFKNGVTKASSGDFKSSTDNFKIAKILYDSSKITTDAVASAPLIFSNSYLSDYLNVYENVLAGAPILLDTLKRADGSSLNKEKLERSFAFLFELYFIAQRYSLKEFYDVLKIEDQNNFSKFVSLTTVLSEVLGFDSQKNYILLFQNSNELRPTGGFIGSVSYITIKNGKVDDMKINDVYELDGQLKGHVEPHFIIRRYLQPHLYLRDSNFSPDFEESASMSAFLYSLETGKRADGVIAIDTQVLRSLIKIAQPFNVAGVGEVNSSNVVDLVQDSIKDNFFPGSTNKKDILNAILNKIIITIEDSQKRVEVFKILPRLISEKNILFSFSDNSVNKAFSAAGFSSSLADYRIGQNLMKDLLSINEANIGVNKVNAFIEREVNYSAYLNGDNLNSEILLDYTNKGKEDYTAYLRTVVPVSSELSSIAINGVIQEIVPAVTDFKVYERTNFKAPVGLEVDEEIRNDKKIVGFIIKVPKKDKARIKINLENSSIIPTTGSFNYSLLYFKQPGTDKHPLVVSLQTDNSYQLENKSPVIFDSLVSSDKEFNVKVFRKETKVRR